VTVTAPGATMYVLRDLQKYQWYEVRIQPFYFTVEGQESKSVRVRTSEDGESQAVYVDESTVLVRVLQLCEYWVDESTVLRVLLIYYLVDESTVLMRVLLRYYNG
jgi:hypothetical protein